MCRIHFVIYLLYPHDVAAARNLCPRWIVTVEILICLYSYRQHFFVPGFWTQSQKILCSSIFRENSTQTDRNLGHIGVCRFICVILLLPRGQDGFVSKYIPVRHSAISKLYVFVCNSVCWGTGMAGVSSWAGFFSGRKHLQYPIGWDHLDNLASAYVDH